MQLSLARLATIIDFQLNRDRPPQFILVGAFPEEACLHGAHVFQIVAVSVKVSLNRPSGHFYVVEALDPVVLLAQFSHQGPGFNYIKKHHINTSWHHIPMLTQLVSLLPVGEGYTSTRQNEHKEPNSGALSPSHLRHPNTRIWVFWSTHPRRYLPRSNSYLPPRRKSCHFSTVSWPFKIPSDLRANYPGVFDWPCAAHETQIHRSSCCLLSLYM